jgi:predicted DNA-binding transcriptional regulator AlpA
VTPSEHVRWSSPTTAEGQEAPVTVRLLTTEEVAARFRTSPATVRYWRHVGIGPAGVRVGRRVLYDELEVDRWWESKVGGDKATRAHS